MPYNPYYPAYYQPNIPSGTNDIQGVGWVTSLDEVRNAVVPFGRKLFMNQNEYIFYVKDSQGNIEVFKFEKSASYGNIDMSGYVTKEEFDKLRSQYEQLIQQQQAANAAANAATIPAATQPNANFAGNAELPGYSGTGQTGVYQAGTGYESQPAAS